MARRPGFWGASLLAGFLAGAAAALPGCAAPGLSSHAAGAGAGHAAGAGAPIANGATYIEQSLAIPVTNADGSVTPILTRLCLPRGGATRPLVLINHGSPTAARRPAVAPAACGSEAVQFFISRGHAVGLPLRRGYGVNTGPWEEHNGGCISPDYHRSGLEAARDMQAAITSLTRRPEVPAGPVIVVGQSAGGWGALALASQNPSGVGAIISMAGGRGGHRHNQPNNNCAPERLVEAAGQFGATARLPMLWVYTSNDSYFAPSLAAAMHAAFTAAGGPARLVALGPYRNDGHGLFFGPGGPAIWGPILENFLP